MFNTFCSDSPYITPSCPHSKWLIPFISKVVCFLLSPCVVVCERERETVRETERQRPREFLSETLLIQAWVGGYLQEKGPSHHWRKHVSLPGNLSLFINLQGVLGPCGPFHLPWRNVEGPNLGQVNLPCHAERTEWHKTPLLWQHLCSSYTSFIVFQSLGWCNNALSNAQLATL